VTTARPGPGRPHMPAPAIFLVAGLALGVATQFLQGILPGARDWIANGEAAAPARVTF